MNPDPTFALFDAVRRYVAAYCPGRAAARVVVFLEDHKTRVDLPVPPPMWNAPAASPRQAAPAGLNATTRRILRAVAGLDAENPTAEEIAEAARMTNDAHTRKLLAAMRQEGWLGGRKGEAGYPLTPKGLAALENDQEP